MSVGTIMRSPAVPTAAMFAKVAFIIHINFILEYY